MKLHVIFIHLWAESGPHLLHQIHLLHLVDNTLLSEVVEIADDEWAESYRIFL